MTIKDYNPNIAIHPGNTLKDILDNLEMSQTELAERMGLTLKTINEIIQGKNPITPETSLRLSAVFGMSAAFWNNLERSYREVLAKNEQLKKLEKEIPLMKKVSCYNDLVKWSYIPQAKKPEERVASLLSFFGVSSLDLIQKTHQVAFRKTEKDNLSKENLAAWLRCGEIQAARMITKKFDKDKLIDAIPKLRALTTKQVSGIENELQEICADFGVAVVFVPYFKNTFVDGATRWLSADKAMIQVSLRGAHIDRFWFTFFHELGHLLKHGKKEQFVEFESGLNKDLESKEKEADDFAGKTLISETEFKIFFKEGDFSDSGISNFANKINISPAIVAGRLAHELSAVGYQDTWKRFSHLRPRITFNNPK